jgi:hypothetical protein
MKKLWQNLESFEAQMDGQSWLMAGDFNVVKKEEKLSCDSLNTY